MLCPVVLCAVLLYAVLFFVVVVVVYFFSSVCRCIVLAGACCLLQSLASRYLVQGNYLSNDFRFQPALGFQIESKVCVQIFCSE